MSIIHNPYKKCSIVKLIKIFLQDPWYARGSDDLTLFQNLHLYLTVIHHNVPQNLKFNLRYLTVLEVKRF